MNHATNTTAARTAYLNRGEAVTPRDTRRRNVSQPYDGLGTMWHGAHTSTVCYTYPASVNHRCGGRTMAKVHKSYRLEQSTIDGVAEWAQAHNVTVTQAMDDMLRHVIDNDMAERQESESAGVISDLRHQVELLTAQLEAAQSVNQAKEETARTQAETWREQKAMLGDNIRDLRETVSTLTAQVNEKDKQIERLQSTLEHSQILQAAHVAGAIRQSSTDVPQEDTQPDGQTDAQPRGVWAWLARKIEGR